MPYQEAKTVLPSLKYQGSTYQRHFQVFLSDFLFWIRLAFRKLVKNGLEGNSENKIKEMLDLLSKSTG